MNDLELEYDQTHEADPDVHAFELHPQLARDSYLLGRFKLCQLRLINDSQYPWFILVPERVDISEIHQLSMEDQQQLLRESSFLSENLSDVFAATKMNVASLGNMVPQLHLHHIVRYESDPAWPGPVWGRFPAKAYADEELIHIRQRVTALLEHSDLYTPA